MGTDAMPKAILRLPILTVACTAVLAATSTDLAAQRVRRSQRGTVSQHVADTRIRIEYNRPVARGRTLFGGLVDWNEVWHPGADEATTLEVTDDVLIAGERLPAGTYSVWTIPRPDEWTLIFSAAADVWHTPYPRGHDALRVSLEPIDGAHMETLAFYFPVVSSDATTLHLHWGTTIVPIPIRLMPDGR